MAARAPWGAGYPPPGQFYPMPNYPEDPRNMRPAFPQPNPGFYNAALSGIVQPGYPPPMGDYGRPGPAPYPLPHSGHSPPNIPPKLKPGSIYYPPSDPTYRQNSGDLFFQGGPPSFPQPFEPRPTIPERPPAVHHAQSSPPPIPPKIVSPPPVPPRPHFTEPLPQPQPQVPAHPGHIATVFDRRHDPSSSTGFPPHFIPDAKEASSPKDEDEEFRKVLEMSEKAERQRRQTISKEEDDLKRAIEASLRIGAPPVPSLYRASSPRRENEPGPSSGYPFPHVLSPVQSPQPFAESSFPAPSFPEPYLPSKPSSPHSPVQEIKSHPQLAAFSPGPSQTSHSAFAADEAFARRLAEEKQNPALQVPERIQTHTQSPSHPQPPAPQKEPDGPPPPTYNDIVSSAPSISAPSPNPATANGHSLLSAPPPTAQSGSRAPSPAIPVPSSPQSNLGRSTSATASTASTSTSAHSSDSRAGRSQSFTAVRPPASAPAITVETRPSPVAGPSSPSTLRTGSPPGGGAHRASTSQPPPTQSGSQQVAARPPLAGSVSDSHPVGPNQFINIGLLKGVSLGFTEPTISTTLMPLNGPIPNVVALPYGRCPPFHLKAPTWRDLIKLLARLSGTRLEPTIEAMAAVKTEMRLRVVANFVKIHQTSASWHVVIYMTIDYPVAKEHAQASKYRSKDPNVLPFSYTLSPYPALLRESSDAPMSKWFDIPSTETNPWPKLPITFPDLARYLMDAVDESRLDSSSGMRRLSKLVDTFYPSEQGSGNEEAEPSGGILNFFKRKKPPAYRNDQIYDVVTPFVADDWGG